MRCSYGSQDSNLPRSLERNSRSERNYRSSRSHARIIDVLRLLADKYGKSFRNYVFNPKTNEVNSYLLFSLNGVNVSGIKGTETEIEDGSKLLILSATGGG